jgi:molybdopterin/thiamine biosynthesis adenylyltransferase
VSGPSGRQLALQLAALGVPELHLVDFDRVDAVNLAPQGFLETELGRLKVEAVAETCRRSNSQATVRAYPERFRRSGLYLRPAARRLAVFACVDSIETRGFSLARTAAARALLG